MYVKQEVLEAVAFKLFRHTSSHKIDKLELSDLSKDAQQIYFNKAQEIIDFVGEIKE